METMRLILVVAAHEDWKVHHVDVKSVFLNKELAEEVYVHQPLGFTVGREEQVLKLNKALYGLFQAPRAWYSKPHSSLNFLSFTYSDQEHAVYTRRVASRPLVVSVYVVDDKLIVGPVSKDINKFKLEMHERFRMSDLRLLTYYLGIKVRQDEVGISLCQSSYALKLLKKTGMHDCNSCLTPMEGQLQLSNGSSVVLVNATEYKSVVGALRYLLHTRADLAHDVSYMSLFRAEP
jgi:hypothetical protein